MGESDVGRGDGRVGVGDAEEVVIGGVAVLDELVLPAYDLAVWRTSVGVLSVGVLLFGLIFEDRR